MSMIVSRWPVLLSVPLAAGDCGADGRLTDAAVARLFALARDAYFEQCPSVDPAALELLGASQVVGVALDPAALELLGASHVVGVALDPDSAPTISVNVTEVYPDSFRMTAHIRPEAGEGIAADAACVLAPPAGVPDAMRDEFIALAHGARYTH